MSGPGSGNVSAAMPQGNGMNYMGGSQNFNEAAIPGMIGGGAKPPGWTPPGWTPTAPGSLGNYPIGFGSPTISNQGPSGAPGSTFVPYSGGSNPAGTNYGQNMGWNISANDFAGMTNQLAPWGVNAQNVIGQNQGLSSIPAGLKSNMFHAGMGNPLGLLRILASPQAQSGVGQKRYY